MRNPTETHTRDAETREDLAEAREHQGEAREHRREGAADRAEARVDRATGDGLGAVGNELEAKGHDLAARGHERAAEHDRREAVRESREHTPLGESGTSDSLGSETAARSPAATNGNGQSLLGDEHLRRFRSRWDAIQASFVDEPRTSVAEADSLVREATEALHSQFERDRRQLEGAWDRGDDVSTEDLRVTLQRYRSFFDRLLTI